MLDDVPAPTKVARLLCQSEIFKTKRQGFVTFKRSASGKDIVDLLVRQIWCHSRADAEKICQLLCHKGLLFHVTYEQAFSDSSQLYRCANQATIQYMENLECTMTSPSTSSKQTQPMSVPISTHGSTPMSIPGTGALAHNSNESSALSLTASLVASSLLLHQSELEVPTTNRILTNAHNSSIVDSSIIRLAHKQQLLVSQTSLSRSYHAQNDFIKNMFQLESDGEKTPKSIQLLAAPSNESFAPPSRPENRPSSVSTPTTATPETESNASAGFSLQVRDDWFNTPKPPTPTIPREVRAPSHNQFSQLSLESTPNSAFSTPSDISLLDTSDSISGTSITSEDIFALNNAVGHAIHDLNDSGLLEFSRSASTDKLSAMGSEIGDRDDVISMAPPVETEANTGFFSSLLQSMKSKAQRKRLIQYSHQIQLSCKTIESERKKYQGLIQKTRDKAQNRVRRYSNMGLPLAAHLERTIAQKQVCGLDLHMNALSEVRRVLDVQVHVTKKILTSGEVSPVDVPSTFFRKPAEIIQDVMEQQGAGCVRTLQDQVRNHKVNLKRMAQTRTAQQSLLGRAETLMAMLDQITTLIEDIRSPSQDQAVVSATTSPHSSSPIEPIIKQDHFFLNGDHEASDPLSSGTTNQGNFGASSQTIATTHSGMNASSVTSMQSSNDAKQPPASLRLDQRMSDVQLAMNRRRRDNLSSFAVAEPVKMALHDVVKEFSQTKAAELSSQHNGQRRRAAAEGGFFSEDSVHMTRPRTDSVTTDELLPELSPSPAIGVPATRNPSASVAVPLASSSGGVVRPHPLVPDNDLPLHLFRARSEFVELEHQFAVWLLDDHYPDCLAVNRFLRVVLHSYSRTQLADQRVLCECSPVDIVGFLEQYWRSVAERYGIHSGVFEMALSSLVQGFIFDRVGVGQFQSLSLQCARQDALFRHNARWIRLLPPCALDVNHKFCRNDAASTREVYKRAVDSIEDVEMLTTPADMLLCVFECSKKIILDGCAGASCSSDEFGADNLLPLLVFVLSCAALNCPNACVNYIQALSSSEDISSELGYYFVGFEVAVTFVTTAEPSSYAKDLGDLELCKRVAHGIAEINEKFDQMAPIKHSEEPAPQNPYLGSLMKHMEVTDDLESLGF